MNKYTVKTYSDGEHVLVDPYGSVIQNYPPGKTGKARAIAAAKRFNKSRDTTARSNPSDSALAGARILGVTRNRAGKVTALKLQLKAGAGGSGGGPKRSNPSGGYEVMGISSTFRTKTAAMKRARQLAWADKKSTRVYPAGNYAAAIVVPVPKKRPV